MSNYPHEYVTMYGCPLCNLPVWASSSGVCPRCGADSPSDRQWPLLVFKRTERKFLWRVLGDNYEFIRPLNPAHCASGAKREG